MDILDLFNGFRRYFSIKGHKIILAFACILGLLIGVEIGLNIWVRSALETSLLAESKTARVNAAISWMGLSDFLSGRVGWVRVDARDCRIGNFNYHQLKIDNHGFIFNLPVLIRERRLMVMSVNRTFAQVTIQTQTLQNYLNVLYSQYQPRIAISPTNIELTGVVKIFGSPLPVRLVGALKLSGPKKLRFDPLSLRLGNKPVSGSLLQFAATQIPLQFTVLEDWPLQITDFSLGNSTIQIKMSED